MDHTIGAAGLVQPTSRGRLLRLLGVSFGVAVLIGNTILIGILRTVYRAIVARRDAKSGAVRR